MSVSPAPTETASTAAFDACGLRVGILVVAYEDASRIQATLSRIPDEIWRAIAGVYVVDDASTDDTVDQALDFGRGHDKTVVLRNRISQDHGGVQKIGYQYAIEHGLDVVALLHADGKFAPESLSAVLGPVCRGEADVVIGSRMLDAGAAREGGMPPWKRWGNRGLTRLQNALCGTSFSEFFSSYRAFRVDFLRQVSFWENTDGWHFDTQILLQAVRHGARVVEVPVPTFYGTGIHHAQAVSHGVNSLATAFAFFLYRAGLLYARSFDVSIKGRRYFEKFNDPASSHSLIWRYLERHGVRGKTVLELGTGDASLTRRLHEAGATVDGIELDALSAQLAQPYCRRVFVNDLDNMDEVPLVDAYDIVIAADVLEHLRTPDYVLSRLKRHVKVGGLLVVSLPNIANLYVRLNLLLGRYPTHSKGLLDRTHLHCYTLKTGVQLARKCGWVILDREVTAMPLPIVFPFLVRAPFSLLLRFFHLLTHALPGLLGYQGLLYCRNPNKASLL